MTHWIWKTAKTSSWQCFGHLDPWIQADLLDFKHSGCWLFAWVYKIDWLLLTLYYWALRRPHQWLQTPPTACRERRDSVYYTKPVGFCSWMSYTTKAHPALQRQSRVRKKRTWGKRRLKKGVTEQNQKGGQDWCYNYAEGRRTTGKRRARPSQPTMAAVKRGRTQCRAPGRQGALYGWPAPEYRLGNPVRSFRGGAAAGVGWVLAGCGRAGCLWPCSRQR